MKIRVQICSLKIIDRYMGFYKFIVGLIVISLFSFSAFAQEERTDCEQTLAMAAEEFNSGRFYGVPSLLKPCIDRGFSREQKQRAYLLLAQTYLLLDDPISAENSYLEVLRANPEFETDTALHPIDLVYLSKKFTADPIFAVFGKVGGNTSMVRVIETISPSGQPVTNDYGLRLGIQFGGGVDWNITRDLSLTGEFTIATASYKKDQVRFNLDELQYTGNQLWMSVPIYFKLSAIEGKIRPFGYAGLALHWLTSERGRIISIKTDVINDGPPQSTTRESPTLTLTEFRNKINRSFLVGGGVRYKMGLNYLFADLRYTFGLSNIVIPTSTNGYDSPMIEYGHADDFFRMDNLAISFGIVKPFYNPRKLKKPRTRMILKGINKSDD